MSRAHDRAYRLLAERMRLADPARWALYGVFAVLIASGAWWLAVHYEGQLIPTWNDELRRLALEAWSMRVHGAAALVTLVCVGAMLTNHARRGWTLARNRGSGATVIAAFLVLTLTGYALYYLVSDVSRPPVSMVHWGLGLALVPLLALHIVLGRRSRARNAW
jgi:hypothetical protein